MRPRFRSAWSPIAAALLAALLASAPRVARAQTAAVCTVSEVSAAEGFHCGLEPCANASTCPARFDVAVCEAFLPGIDSALCRPKCGAIFDCMTAGECPRLDRREVTCVIPESRPPGLNVSGICVYDETTYCDDRVTAEHIRGCHTTPDGRLTSSWLFGDCDRDGCPNGRDPSPCTAGPPSECGTITVGDGPCVAPVPPYDGGVPEPDGGIAPPDAGTDGGTVERDGGTDGGTVEHDAGGGDDAGTTDAPDGGPFDAGSFDAGTAPTEELQFTGGGGCRCAVPGGTRERSGGALTALALLAGAIVARRRAR